ncbi:hypothetical protein WM40_00910 [Robbsia andropogonis]|uniref:Uncharacterized protein n=1 Tax=Robbsia andropogonis TaxID=28092 RepID=A0A0F5K6R6_9BURK|nr:hypothetical protein WM40_00910 [Robbsia andropogonis]
MIARGVAVAAAAVVDGIRVVMRVIRLIGARWVIGAVAMIVLVAIGFGVGAVRCGTRVLTTQAPAGDTAV